MTCRYFCHHYPECMCGARRGPPQRETFGPRDSAYRLPSIGWRCPDCDAVHAPDVKECIPCHTPLAERVRDMVAQMDIAELHAVRVQCLDRLEELEREVPSCEDYRFRFPAQSCCAERCTHPDYIGMVLSSGKLDAESTGDARDVDGHCGPEGKLFEAKA